MSSLKLAGKVAVITGAGSGMGRASAVLFAKEGAKVVVADIVKEGGENTVKEIVGAGGSAVFTQADVSKAADVERMVQTAIDNYGRIDILYNNAGIPHDMKNIEDISEELWDHVFGVNVKGIFLGAKYAVPWMKKQGGGVIINTASISGVRARPGLAAYTASKGAAIMLTKALAIELAPSKIRVNCINPVAADTPMLPSFFAKGISEEEARARFLATIPLGRFATAEDVAYAALYLASDEANMVTGIELNVDGGRSI